MENSKLLKELLAEEKKLQAEIDRINSMLDPIKKLIIKYKPEVEQLPGATIKKMGRSTPSSDAAQQVLESLQYITEGTATDVLKVYKELYPTDNDLTAKNTVKFQLSKMNGNGLVEGKKMDGKNSYWYKYIGNNDAINQ